MNNMRQYLLVTLVLILTNACIESKDKGKVNLELMTDTLIVELLPNRVVRTDQFINGDSLKSKISREEYFNDCLIVKEVYRNYMTSEYDGYGDGENQYFYNKGKKLILKYFIESSDGDTVKFSYQYFTNNRECNITVSDLRKRLKKNMPHGDVIEPEDLTEKRVWLFSTMWKNSYDKNNRLIQHYEPIKDNSNTNQNRYTYKYHKGELIEADSYINDSTLYWTEKYEYKENEIIMTNDNLKKESDGDWLLPFYIEITKLDQNKNKIIIEKYDNKRVLMRRYLNKYDEKNRLIKTDCFDEKNNLKLSQRLIYESSK